jgi:hypothetical protein
VKNTDYKNNLHKIKELKQDISAAVISISGVTPSAAMQNF